MAISGQTTVAAAGTAVPLADDGTLVRGMVRVKALPTNTNKIYIGNDGAGDVSSTTGYILSAGDDIIYNYVGDMYAIKLDAAVDGEGVCWCVLEVM